jgi:putative serine protease PepD
VSTSTRRIVLAVAAVAIAVVGGGIGAALVAATQSGGTTTVVISSAVPVTEPASTPADATGTARGTPIAAIAAKANRSVVQIEVTSTSNNGFGEQTQQAQGSGFVFDAKGHVITNAHVVSSATKVNVSFADGSTYVGSVVGTDLASDVAVVKITAPASQLHPLPLGDSSAVRVGDEVVAVGSPFGLATTVTSGIVSALNREITSPSNTPIEGAIQTDAAINHGNSGGPLFDARGRVIGVNSQIESDSGGNDGVGFAVPSNTVKLIATQLIATGSADHAQLGVTVATIPAQVAGKLGIAAGVAVGTVQAGSAADTSGLKASTGTKIVGNTGYPIGGDVITAFDGVPVTTAEQLRGVIDSHRVGDRVTMTVVRGGKTRTVSVRLGRRS